jgi:hypothetical protein
MDDKQTEIHPLVGVAHDAEVITSEGEATGEKVVYEYDENGEFVGWHKEPIE